MYTQFRVVVLSLTWAAMCLAHALAQTVQPQPIAPVPQSAISSPASVEQIPPSKPTITYKNGLLTITAYKSTLSDILQGISNQTGADIDIPPHADELVAVHLGPGPARDVVQSLLAGSRFNYVIVGSNTDSNTLTKILLLPRLAAISSPQLQANTASSAPLPTVERADANEVEETVRQPDYSGEPALPVRAQQQMLQQRQQTVMEKFQQNQRPK